MLEYTDFHVKNRVVLLGRIPGQDGWIGMGKGEAHLVSSEMVESAPHYFVHARHVPPGTHKYMRPVESPPLEVLFTPDIIPWPLVPRFGSHTTVIEPLLVGEQWRVYCGYDTLAQEWVVAGEPEEVSHASKPDTATVVAGRNGG